MYLIIRLSESRSLLTIQESLDYNVDTVPMVQLLRVYTKPVFSHPGCPPKSLSLGLHMLEGEGLDYYTKEEIVWITSLL